MTVKDPDEIDVEEPEGEDEEEDEEVVPEDE